MRLPPIPVIQDPNVTEYIRQLSMALNKEFAARPTKDQAVHSVLLLSPGGKVYSVTVADDGTLSTALVGTGL
jgi:hypothetical protein